MRVTLRSRASRYVIRVENPHRETRGLSAIEVDGVRLADPSAGIPLADDGTTHQMRALLGGSPIAG